MVKLKLVPRGELASPKSHKARRREIQRDLESWSRPKLTKRLSKYLVLAEEDLYQLNK